MAQLELVHPTPLELISAERRGDHLVISQMVSDGARVLDVGCGDGALLQMLKRECNAQVRGIELDPNKAHRCVVRGMSVVQGDAERDLGEFPSAAFDYVVFSCTLQHLRRPQAALKQAGRIGQQVIVSITNAGRWDKRIEMLTKGRLGPSEHLQRYTIRDFADLAREMHFGIERAVPLSRGNPGAPFAKTIWRANWFAEEAVFLLTS
ncbi:MAG: methyltransferase domain-containing protein [Hyphomonadaceae bacterium]|nr:methyltransferase domain-containing protein [Hyphomonadaceae bacterium]